MYRSRRVLQVVESLDGYGTAARLRRLAPRMAELGWTFELGALRASPSVAESFASQGVRTRRLDRRWKIDPAACLRLAACLRRGRYALVHAWGAASAAHVALACAVVDPTPWAVSIDRSDVQSRWSAALLRSIARRVGRCFVPDDATAIWCRGRGVAADRIDLAPAGVTPAPQPPIDRKEFLARLGLPTEVRVIATASRLEPACRLDEAIWCYELIRILRPECRFVVFGEGPDRSRLQRSVRLMSDEAHVRLAGCRDDLPELLPHVDAFWQLTGGADDESLRDAMASGAPVIAAEPQSHPAPVVAGVNGLIADARRRNDVARLTLRLMEEEAWARKLARAGQATAAQLFSADEEARDYDRVYSVIARAAG